MMKIIIMNNVMIMKMIIIMKMMKMKNNVEENEK